MSEYFRTPWLSDVVNILKRDSTNRITVGNKEFVLVRHGHWDVYSCRSYHYIRYICSECGTVYTTVEGYQYCPNCGAKIDKNENNYITDIE